MTTSLEFGLDTFGDVTKDAAGAALPHARVIRNVVDEAVLADEIGIDFIGLGEHHRADFAISSPKPCWRRSPPAPKTSASVRR